MPKMTLGQKSPRFLRFLQGLADRRVVAAMSAAGFTQTDLDEGWQLLRDASSVRYAKTPTEASAKVVGEVDAWENYWYLIIEATLRRRFPEIHQQVFLNLSQESGPPVLITVRILLDRLVELDKATDKQSKDARAVLKDRGLNKAALDEVKALLEQAATAGDPTDVPVAEEAAEERDRAETAMWDWYKEWSQIARAAVKDGRLLVQLGLINTGRPKRGGEEPEPVGPEPVGPQD